VGIVDRLGEIVWADRGLTPTTRDADVVAGALGDLVARAGVAATGIGELAACGVGCGGPMTFRGETVSPLNIPAWRSFPLRERLSASLAESFGTTRVAINIDNDAKALALAEGWLGAARGVSNYIAMVVSTGVGAGIVLEGRLLKGASGNAGHIGHVIVEPGGRSCSCGARGCLEAEASGTAIAVATGDPAEMASAQVQERTGRLVGRAVGSVANLLDLRLAVVGGSVALGYGARFFQSAQHETDAVARLDFSRGCRVEPAGLGPDGPLVGAAALGWAALDPGSSRP
jgi:glucokinase